jgi:WD40 repeat protein
MTYRSWRGTRKTASYMFTLNEECPLFMFVYQSSVKLYLFPLLPPILFQIPVLDVLETPTASFSQNAPSAVAVAPIAASQPTPALTAIAPQVQPILIGHLTRSPQGPLSALTKIGALHISNPESGVRSKLSFIYAFFDGGKRLSVWRVVKPELLDKAGLPVATPDEPITSSLLVDGKALVGESEAVCCACPPSSVELETSQSGIRASESCSIVTGGVDGMVRGWSCSMTDSAMEIYQCFEFKAAEEPVISVKSAFLGRIATRARSSACIDVWESESHAPNFLLESSLNVLEQPVAAASRARNAAAAFKPVVVSRVGSRAAANTNENTITSSASESKPPRASSPDDISFDWLSLVSGGQLLAVTAGGAIQLWCLRRSSDLFSFKPQWSRVDSFANNENLGGTCVVWTSLGQLVLAREEQLVVLSQWLDSNQGTIPRLVEDENKSLPFYHPKALVEYLMAGQLDRVHLILKHILSHFQATESRRREELKARFLSTHSTDDENSASPTWDNATEEQALDQLDPADPISDFSVLARLDDSNVPPLPLNAFPTSTIALQNPDDSVVENHATNSPVEPQKLSPAPIKASSIFDDDPYENISYDSWDHIGFSDGEEETESEPPAASQLAPTPAIPLKDAEYIQPFEWNFECISSSDARRLSSRLAEVGLVSLSPQEQLYLLALLDTLASLERSWIDMAAVRFALTIRYFIWMKKTNRLPQELREPSAGAAPNHTLASLSWCWAMHCHDQTQLINLCIPPSDNSSCVWENVRMFGIPLWCSDNTMLRQLADRLAKQHFLINRDPSDCALFYILLGKRTALQTLYKTARDEKLAGFLSNDFTETRWREAALKNAYALLGKQRYHLAAAFFLLGSSVRDALTVCLANLNDWMLALFVARMMEGDSSEVVHEIFAQHVLPKATQTGDLSLLSASHWFLHDYRRALTSLVPVSEPLEARSASREFNPGILHLFSFLSKHPRIKLLGIQVELDSLRRSLESMAVFAYMRSGLSRLALQSDAMHLRASQTSLQNPDLTSDIEAGLHRRALLQHISKELEHTRVNNAMELNNFMTDMSFLSQAFSVSQASLLTPLLQYCESRLLLKSNYLLLRTQDEKLAARFLIRSAKRIIPICLSLVTYPLSTHHARGIHRFTVELHECLTLHSSFPSQTTLSSSTSNLSLSGSVSFGPFSKQARAAMEASIRLGLFLAAWSVGDYDVLLAIIVELGGANWPQSGISRLSHAPMSLDQLIDACSDLKPSPVEPEEQEKLEPETRMFLRGLFHLLLLYKFISLLEESLARNGFQQPGQLNMIRTLRHWLFTAESSLKDIPNQIVRERFSEILHSKSKTVFDFAFFDNFTKLGSSFATSSPCRKHLWDTFGRDEGVIAQYLQRADFLKQGMRFVRLLHDLRADFDEEVQKHAGTRLSVEYERHSAGSADQAVLSTGVRDILLDIDSRLRRSPSPSPRSPSPASSQGEIPSDTDSVGSTDSATLGDLVSDASFLPVRPSPVRPSAKRRNMAVADIRFGEPLVVFRDKDILQSFCINPTRSKQMAVATTHGISEIIVTSDAHVQTVLRRSSSEPELGTSSAPTVREPREGASMTEDDKQDVANWIESHPTFPYYLSGSVDGSVRLWQFNVPQSLATYREKTSTRLTKLHFNWNGTKFAAADQSGNVQLWRFDANEESTRPFVSLPCHSRRSADVVFLNSGSVVASAGESSGNKNVCIWDTLLPPARGEVASFVCQPDGATAMVYSPRWQLLICGGKQGNLSILDVRQRKIVQELDGHSRAIKDLSIDPSQNWMISGSNEGNVKIWDLSTLTVVDTWAEAHSRQTFVRNAAVLGAGPISTHGVMQVKFSRNHCYTCGSDGRLVQRRFEADSF